ncbi:PASTA domain-containing protein [bacterium]|nr:PASTA domain-containing protein [candidate division CSSED10-310 bacterium]
MNRFMRLLWIPLWIVLVIGAGIGSFWLTLLLFSKSPEVRVPDLRGLDFIEAIEITQSRDLVLYLEERVFNDEQPRGMIVQQVPEPGQLCKPGRKIKVRISRGRARIDVPDLRGLPLRQAAHRLEILGLTPGEVTAIHSDLMGRGLVLATAPPAGAAMDSGRLVKFIVSEGNARQFVMPSLVDGTLEDARAFFGKAGIKIQNVRYRSTGGAAQGTVLAQIPSPGLPVSGADDIHLTVQGTVQQADEKYRFVWQAPTSYRASTATVVMNHGDAQETLWENKIESGEKIVAETRWTDGGTISVYLDGNLVYKEQL